ncbi:hypothetical protein FBU30_002519 [Linnemannia zychae]|nr:hypothetical protein FBU30_002519 [Linnemannia zychae]
MTKAWATDSVLVGLVMSLALSASFIPITISGAPTASPSKGTPTTAAAPTATPIKAIDMPSAFLGVASATGDGQIFYQGGQLNQPEVKYSNELYSLDVTKSWIISEPAWTNLTTPNGGPRVGGHSATMSKDNKNLYLTAPSGNPNSPFWYKYSIQSKTWAADSAPAAQAAAWANRRDAQLVTDPATAAIWYIGGSTTSGDTNEIDKFLNDDWSANMPTIKDGDTTSTPSIMGSYSAGTSHLIENKIYIFGGFSSVASSPRTYQSFQILPWLDISTSPPTIGTQFTLGTVPPPRQDHCSVLTSSKKVIIYGGYDSNTKTSFDDVWSLDLVTLTWQRIVTVNPTLPRSGHNCNIVGANMIVFGGRASNVGYSDVQVYDVMLSSWMTSFTPKEDTTPISSPLPGGVGGSGGSHSALSTAGLVGIIVGVIALLGCGIGIFIYRRRQRKIEIREAEMEKEAYLASLRTDDDDKNGSKSRRRHKKTNPYSASSPFSTSTRHLNQRGVSMDVMDTPATIHTHYDPMEMSPSGSGNVQYLMQQLPDGTIAVQPVYLDHQTMGQYGGSSQLQHSPNIMYSESSSLTGVLNSPSPPLQNTTVNGTGPGSGSGSGSRNDFVPPPSAVNSTNPTGISPFGGSQSAMSSPALPASSSMTPKSGHTTLNTPSVPFPRPVHNNSGTPSPILPQAPPSTNYNPSGTTSPS